MKVEQQQWTSGDSWNLTSGNLLNGDADLVFAFGGRTVLEDSGRYDEIKALYPNAHILCGSTSGEILDGIIEMEKKIKSKNNNMDTNKDQKFWLYYNTLFNGNGPKKTRIVDKFYNKNIKLFEQNKSFCDKTI